MLGFAKNAYSRWKLRNYSSVEARLLDPTPAMIEARITNKLDSPFGIRALESGVEIEGVWISRSNLNTPTTSRPHSPSGSTSSSFLDEPTTPSFAIRESARARILSSQSSVPSWYAPSRRASSDAGSTASWTIDTNGFKHVDTYKPRPMSTPSAGKPHNSAGSAESAVSDASSMDYMLKRSKSSVCSNEGAVLTTTAPTVSSDDNYKATSSSTMATSPSTSINGSELSKISHEEPQAASSSDDQEKDKKKADLGLLHTHRLSHVAETGQLVPRSKRSPRTSGEWSRTAPTRAPRPRHPPISMHNRGMSRSLPTTPTDDVQNPFDFVVPKRNVSTTNLLSNGSAHVEHPKDENKRKDSKEDSEDIDTAQPAHFYEQNDGAISAIATLSRPPAVYVPTFEHEKDPEVLRRVNDDFQIMKPRPLPEPPTDGRKARTVSRDRSKRHSRRLSKERPSTNARGRNSFIEVLYGNERRPRF